MPGTRLLLACVMVSFGLKGQVLPPGVIKVDSILIDEAEITNLHWLEYLYYLKRDSSDHIYHAALPDTSVWEQVYESDLAMTFSASYLRSPAFQHFPVVGVTYEQATGYCQWRSLVVNEKIRPENQHNLPVKYRLPTPSEWLAVAQTSESYQPLSYSGHLDRMKFKRSDLTDIKEQSGFPRSIVKLRESIIAFYRRNPILLMENLDTREDYEYKPYLGIGYGTKRSMGTGPVHDLRGNVSEMTTEEGTAMGGNWTTTFEETPAYVRFEYTGPSPVVGFRCICEMKP